MYPELFSTPVSPRTQECIQNNSLTRKTSNINPKEFDKFGIKDKAFFEENMKRSFKQI